MKNGRWPLIPAARGLSLKKRQYEKSLFIVEEEGRDDITIVKDGPESLKVNKKRADAGHTHNEDGVCGGGWYFQGQKILLYIHA